MSRSRGALQAGTDDAMWVRGCRRRAALVTAATLLLVTCLGAVGCGGGSSSSPPADLHSDLDHAGRLCQQVAGSRGLSVGVASATTAGELRRHFSSTASVAATWRDVRSSTFVAVCAVQPTIGSTLPPSPDLTACPDGTYAQVSDGAQEIAVDDSGRTASFTVAPPVPINPCP